MNLEFKFLLSFIVISLHIHAQPIDTSADRIFDYSFQGSNIPINARFANETAEKRILRLFMHRAKSLGIKYFLVLNEKDSLFLAFRYAKQGDTCSVINSMGANFFRADKTGWTIIVGYAREPRHFNDDGDLFINGVNYWFYPTEDP